ncbi:MAG: IS630 family transposase [Microcystaceae cyanobacterium]
MKGRPKTYSIKLTEAETVKLEQMVAARKSPQSLAKRAKVALCCAAHPDWSDAQVASSVGGSEAWVRKWRKRWVQSGTLQEAPRSGRPRKFLPSVRAEVTALACTQPSKMNIPLARWSCSEIASQLVTLGIVVSIATATVWRWLKAEKLKPWRFHSWMHSIDEYFGEKATPILRLYAQASFLIKAGYWVVCVDEKTSIQARHPLHPTQPANGEYPVQVAARYERQGALNLFAALSVAEGLIYGLCREHKKFIDFQAFILEVLVPEAIRRGVRHIYLILDNGSTHAPKQLVEWLNQKQKEESWAFTIQPVWLPKYASWLDQIEIWFSVLQRKLLTPNDFPNRETLRERLKEFIIHYNASAQPLKWSYTVAQMQKKFATNL